MRVGDIFYNYKLNSERRIQASGVDEGYVFAGLADAYSLTAPTQPGASGIVDTKTAVLLGWRFKLKKDGVLGFLQGTQKTYEDDLSDVQLRAVPLLGANIYVEDDVASTFGSSNLALINQLVLKSSFYAAHREQGCACLTRSCMYPPPSPSPSPSPALVPRPHLPWSYQTVGHGVGPLGVQP